MTEWIADASAVACFRENPERFRLQYRLHLVLARPDEAKDAGTAMHKALDYWCCHTIGYDIESTPEPHR